MNTYIYTFGLGHPLGNRYQPIIAVDQEQARQMMADAYAEKWAFGYTKEDFNWLKEQGRFQGLEALPIIKYEEAV